MNISTDFTFGSSNILAEVSTEWAMEISQYFDDDSFDLFDYLREVAHEMHHEKYLEELESEQSFIRRY